MSERTYHLQIQQLRSRNLGPIDLTLQRGERLFITGPSGAGKSLLLRAIADLDPHSGETLLDGIPQQQIPATQWRTRVGYCATESHWWHPLVGEHFPQPEQPWFERLGFEPQVLEWEIARCSSGERQRLGLLRLLHNRPEILLLDEPTANLDPHNAKQVEQLLRDYQQQFNASLIWVSHQPEQITRLAHRVLRLAGGTLQPEEIR